MSVFLSFVKWLSLFEILFMHIFCNYLHFVLFFGYFIITQQILHGERYKFNQILFLKQWSTDFNEFLNCFEFLDKQEHFFVAQFGAETNISGSLATGLSVDDRKWPFAGCHNKMAQFLIQLENTKHFVASEQENYLGKYLQNIVLLLSTKGHLFLQ